ncbi:hypothetical protein [Lysinibacillus sp. K60]|uniref:hypothetical protein n=1 Tax=Lysinibacillus sp. K60 TaxID=2720027 RepID=UPI001C8B6BA8|nr:hypothetical protein [Lysinibacillus sp. K60]MBX8946804.1 hypothetical protein [Lysinibacillus sp. K60]
MLKRLESEALTQYATTKGQQFFRKLFHSTQIEIEKKQYIAAYIEEHFPEQLKQALQRYHVRVVE